MIERGVLCLLKPSKKHSVPRDFLGMACWVRKYDPNKLPRPFSVELCASGLPLLVSGDCLMLLQPGGEHWQPSVECAHMEGLDMADARKWSHVLDSEDRKYAERIAREAIAKIYKNSAINGR